ncbi:hypothetical protein [Mycolicibacterium rutilum]|nr:hypothetical protein [Mycolicibacterium rutilum]
MTSPEPPENIDDADDTGTPVPPAAPAYSTQPPEGVPSADDDIRS